MTGITSSGWSFPGAWVVAGFLLVVFLFRFWGGFRGERMNVGALRQELSGWAGESAEKLLIDVREPGEFVAGHVPGARNIPLGEVERRAGEFSACRALFVICQRGGRSVAACNLLAEKVGSGCRVVNIDGGTGAWVAAGFPVERGNGPQP